MARLLIEADEILLDGFGAAIFEFLLLTAVTIVRQANIKGGSVAIVSLDPGTDQETSSKLTHLTEFKLTVGSFVVEGAGCAEVK